MSQASVQMAQVSVLPQQVHRQAVALAHMQRAGPCDPRTHLARKINPLAEPACPLDLAQPERRRRTHCGHDELILDGERFPRVPIVHRECLILAHQSAARSPTPRGARRSVRFARPERERIAPFAPACASTPSVAVRPRAARSPISGASSLATETAACGRETLVQSLQAVRLERRRADGRPITQNLRCARRAGVAPNSSFGGAVAHTRPTRVVFAHARREA